MSEIKKRPSIKKNYIYNSLYQIFTMLVPIITTPYISKTLLPDGIGKYSYTYSIVSFFVLFAQLGFGYYAQREVAKLQDDKYKQTVIFYEIIIVKSITVTLSLAVYIIMCISGFFGQYIELMWWWIFLILAQGFDIAFLFQGNEDFAKIVVRNLFIKILGIIMIFTLVKEPSDLWIYILSISVSNLLGAASTWLYLPKMLCKVNKNDIHIRHHFKPAIQLFIPTIATIVYSYIDRILIGALIEETYLDVSGNIKKCSDLENGFYEQTDKIIKVAVSIITALGAVMLPRNSKEYATGNKDNFTQNIYLAFNFVFLIACPMMFGIIAIAPNLIPWFLGEGYEKCILYLRIFSPLIILFGLDNVLGIQYLLTTNREYKYTIAVVTGTIINIILNIIFIPCLDGIGAIMASIIAELLIVIMMYSFVNKEISIKKIFINSSKYFIGGIIMFFVVIVLQKFLIPGILQTMFLIIIGGIIYILSLFLLKDKLFMDFISNMYIKIKSKL